MTEREQAAVRARAQALKLGSRSDHFGRALEDEMHASTVKEMADHCVEKVKASLNLAFDVILTTLRSPKAPALVEWAKPMAHLPPGVMSWRPNSPLV